MPLIPGDWGSRECFFFNEKRLSCKVEIFFKTHICKLRVIHFDRTCYGEVYDLVKERGRCVRMWARGPGFKMSYHWVMQCSSVSESDDQP